MLPTKYFCCKFRYHFQAYVDAMEKEPMAEIREQQGRLEAQGQYIEEYQKDEVTFKATIAKLREVIKDKETNIKVAHNTMTNQQTTITRLEGEKLELDQTGRYWRKAHDDLSRNIKQSDLASDRPPYGSVKECPKCGVTDYDDKDFYTGEYVNTGDEEYIEQICAGCGFTWQEQCKDA